MKSPDGPDGAVEQSALTEIRTTLDRLALLTRRRWRTFVLAFIVTALTIQVVGFVWPGTFEAKAAILLQKTRRSASVDVDPKEPTTVVTGAVSEEEVNSEIAVLTSRHVLEATMRDTGLDRLTPRWYLRVAFAPLRAYEWAYSKAHGTPYPTAAQRALAGLAGAVSVERLKESNILVVSYRAGDPRFAETVLNDLLTQYLDWHVIVHSQTDIQPFFTAQTDVLRNEVTELQAKLQTISAAVGVTDFNTARDLAMRQDATLREEELLLERQLKESGGRIASVQDTIASNPNWTRVSRTRKGATSAMDGARAQLLQLELAQVHLESRFTEASPLVAENREKVEAARRSLAQEQAIVAEESTEDQNPMLTTLQQELARSTADRAGAAQRLTAVQEQLRRSRDRMTVLEEQGATADRLTLQLQSAKERYSMYLDRTEKARVDSALDRRQIANVSIVQNAEAPLKPVAPKRLIVLVVSLIGGLAVGIAACAWLELMTMGLAGSIEAAVPRTEPE